MKTSVSDIAFTPSVKAVQKRLGSQGLCVHGAARRVERWRGEARHRVTRGHKFRWISAPEGQRIRAKDYNGACIFSCDGL